MLDEKHEDFIKEAKEKYKNIRKIKCLAFGDEYIYFKREGFNHLLRKGDSYRDVFEQRERLLLIDLIAPLLTSQKTYFSYRKSVKSESTAHFWEFIGSYNDKIVAVIIRQINNNSKHFFSVFYKI